MIIKNGFVVESGKGKQIAFFYEQQIQGIAGVCRTQYLSNNIYVYQLDLNMKKKLEKTELPIQGLKVNPAAAMETVRYLMADHPRFNRCGADEVGTKEERITLYFDFPDAITENEKKELYHSIMKETGWQSVISDSVRQDLLQSQLAKLLGSSIGLPSIHMGERKVMVSTPRPQDAKKVIDQFKATTGFHLQFKGESHVASQIDDNNMIQVKMPSKRLENNQAIEEAKKWAEDRGINSSINEVPGKRLR
jgi:hypothetical protein